VNKKKKKNRKATLEQAVVRWKEEAIECFGTMKMNRKALLVLAIVRWTTTKKSN
jgi:hypothetical protein